MLARIIKSISAIRAGVRAWSNGLMSRCRVCGSGDDVICYDPRWIWAYPIRNTYCPAHCPDHDYTYARYEGHYCKVCAQSPPDDWHCR